MLDQVVGARCIGFVAILSECMKAGPSRTKKYFDAVLVCYNLTHAMAPCAFSAFPYKLIQIFADGMYVLSVMRKQEANMRVKLRQFPRELHSAYVDIALQINVCA